jgi:hypothetical protein
MADSGEQDLDQDALRSNIPRYVRTQIPVCSIEYKKVLRNTRKVKTNIEESQHKLKIIKEKMEDCRRNACEAFKLSINQQEGRSDEEFKGTGSSHTSRQIIFTPGGTKRKGINSLNIFYKLCGVFMNARGSYFSGTLAPFFTIYRMINDKFLYHLSNDIHFFPV